MGGSGTVTGRHPTNENNVPVGYLGVCVRSVRDGSYTHCVNLDCGTAANGWTDGTITCDNRAGDSGWQSTGVHNWNHMVIDCGPFVTNTVEQYTLEIVDNYGGGPWAHLEMQDVVIEAALADETPNIFYSRSLTALEPMVTIDSASGSSCTSTGAPCEVSGNIRPSHGAEPAPFGLQGYTFMQGDDVHLNAPSGVMIDGTWTVDCFIQTPFPCTNCETHVASGWHTLVRGQDQDHPVLLWSEDESTIGAYDNSDRRNADGSSAEFYPTTFKMSELADGWHRLTVTGAEDITSYYIDGEKVGEVYFVATRDIYQVGNAPSLTQPWMSCLNRRRPSRHSCLIDSAHSKSQTQSYMSQLWLVPDPPVLGLGCRSPPPVGMAFPPSPRRIPSHAFAASGQPSAGAPYVHAGLAVAHH